MKSFEVQVNDPAYAEGTELVVTGINHLFINGETVTIDEDMANSEWVGNLEEYLHAVAGFTVHPVGAETPQAVETAASGGGEN